MKHYESANGWLFKKSPSFSAIDVISGINTSNISQQLDIFGPNTERKISRYTSTTDRNEKEGKQVNLERHRMSLEATSRFDQWYYLPLISARRKYYKLSQPC